MAFGKPVITLKDGREIHLTRMYRDEIYAGMLEGVPQREQNLQIIQEYGHKGLGLFGHLDQTEPLLLPTQVRLWPKNEWVFWEISSIPDAEPWKRKYEYLPRYVTVALFNSEPTKNDPVDNDSSSLAVMWFQEDPHQFIEEELLGHLQQVNWDGLATGWRF